MQTKYMQTITYYCIHTAQTAIGWIQGMHELIKCIPWMQCKFLWIKVIAKCIKVMRSR